jgi:hypothetical protein
MVWCHLVCLRCCQMKENSINNGISTGQFFVHISVMIDCLRTNITYLAIDDVHSNRNLDLRK